jgi:hypothetical protein
MLSIEKNIYNCNQTKTCYMSNLKMPLVIILCFFFNIKSFCQTEFTKGYIVFNNGDSLNGFLQEDAEDNLLTKVIYSDNASGNPHKEYNANEIKSFYFNGGNLFESVHFRDVNDSPAVCFAKYILKGYYSLYSFRKKDIQYFLIKHEDSTYFLYDDIILNSGGYDTKGNYQNQFLFLSRNCSKLADQIPQLRYSEKDFIAFVHKINDCVAPGSTNSNVSVKSKSKTSLYVYAGGLPLGDKYEYTGRVLVRIASPSISRSFSLNAGFNYLAHKTTEEKSGKKYDDITDIYSLSLTVQNNFTTGIIQPYIEAGFGVGYQSVKGGPHGLYDQNIEDNSGIGVDFIMAIGIEGYITKKLAVKADWRYELLMHYPVVGVAYFF